MSFQDTNIGRNTITKFDLNQITHRELFGLDGNFLSIADDKSELRNQILKRLHNFATLSLLKVGEDTRHNYDSRQYNTQVQLIIEFKNCHAIRV